MFLVCSFLIATGAPDCSPPMPLNDAVAEIVADNETFPYQAGKDMQTPLTLFSADNPPKRK